MRLGVLTSHPIQYHAPLYRSLARRIDLQVFFAHRQTAQEQAAAGYGVAFDWDTDLLEGYAYTFLANRASRPGTGHFLGCDSPGIYDELAIGMFDAFAVTGWNLKAYWQAVRACRRGGIPVLARGDSQLGTPRSLAKRLAKEIMYPPMLQRFDGHLYVGQRNREYLMHYGVPEEQLFFVPHAVDNAWFAAQAAAAAPKRSELRAAWGASDETVVLLSVGRLITLKRPGDLIAGAACLGTRGYPTLPVFVGAGPLEGEVRCLSAQLGVRSHLAGFKNQSELPACYAAADLLVLPSSSETWGLVANEAMACGLPVIASDAVGCAPDLIEPQRTGERFPVGDVASLVDAVERFVPLIGTRSVVHALRRKMERYSLEVATDGVLGSMETTLALKT